jgi:hypothetical protein
MTFTFNSRDTYLAYRADWTRRYLEHIKVVQAAKHGIRAANREYAKGAPVMTIWRACWNLSAAQKITTELLAEKRAASAEAGRQMHARK